MKGTEYELKHLPETKDNIIVNYYINKSVIR